MTEKREEVVLQILEIGVSDIFRWFGWIRNRSNANEKLGNFEDAKEDLELLIKKQEARKEDASSAKKSLRMLKRKMGQADSLHSRLERKQSFDFKD